MKVYEHGIINNSIVQKSRHTSIFDLCRQYGLITAVSAYFWISELYVRAPFDYVNDRIQLNSDSSINHGIYYYDDVYPDSYVFSDGEFLRQKYNPDFLLIHPMNIDDSGHKRINNEQDLNIKAAKVNIIMSTLIPQWIEDGYNVVITADHGMNEHGLHGGNSLVQRLVPLYIFSDRVKKGVFCNDTISQLSIAPILSKLLGIEKAPGMKSFIDLGVDIFE